MNKAGFRNWVEQNKQEDEQVLWAGSPRMVYFRGLFFTRVIPGLVLLGLAGWFYLGAPGIPLPEWAMFLTDTFPKEIVLVLGLLFVVLPFLRAYMLATPSTSSPTAGCLKPACSASACASGRWR